MSKAVVKLFVDGTLIGEVESDQDDELSARAWLNYIRIIANLVKYRRDMKAEE